MTKRDVTLTAHQHGLLDGAEIGHGRPGLHVLHHVLLPQQLVRAVAGHVLIGAALEQLLGGRGEHHGKDVVRVSCREGMDEEWTVGGLKNWKWEVCACVCVLVCVF